MLVLPALIVYILLFLPFAGLIPYLDGQNELLVALNFYQGKYFSHWMQYHPPLKPVLVSLLFKPFGFSSYNFLGYIFGIAGILALYVIALKLFDKKTALLSSLFLAGSGLYLTTSVFSLNDFLMTVFILLAFAFYVSGKYFWYAVMITFAVLVKESAVLFPLSVLLVDGIRKKFRIFDLMPFVTLTGWLLAVHLSGHHLWNEWNFSSTAKKGIVYTIFANLITGSIFNNYALENWLHLFFFNFNWVFWLFAFLSLRQIRKTPPLLIISVFSLAYAVLILTFQTFTITRYILPVLPFVYLLAAAYLRQAKYRKILVPVVFCCLALSLFSSVDPISNLIWNKRTVLGDMFYTQSLDGKDGITYNLQFLSIARDRDSILRSTNCKAKKITLDFSPQTIPLFHLAHCQ